MSVEIRLGTPKRLSTGSSFSGDRGGTRKISGILPSPARVGLRTARRSTFPILETPKSIHRIPESTKSHVIWQAPRKERNDYNPNKSERLVTKKQIIKHERLIMLQKKEFAADMIQAKTVMRKLLALGIGGDEAKRRTLAALHTTMKQRSYGKDRRSGILSETEKQPDAPTSVTKLDNERAHTPISNNAFLRKLRTREKIRANISIKKLLSPVGSAMQDYMRAMDEEDRKRREELEKQLQIEKIQKQQEAYYTQDERANERRLVLIRQTLAQMTKQQEAKQIHGSDVVSLLPQTAPSEIKSGIIQHTLREDGSYEALKTQLSHTNSDSPESFIQQAAEAIVKSPAVTMNDNGIHVTATDVQRVLHDTSGLVVSS